MTDGAAPPPDSRSRTSRRVLVILLALLVLALVAVVVVIGVRELSGISRAKAAPSPSSALTSPVAQPSAGRTTGATVSTPTARTTRPPSTAPTKKAAPAAPAVTVRAGAAVRCAVPPEDAPGASTPPNPSVTITWSSSSATKAWFGIDTDDAQAEPYSQVGPRGSITVAFPCPTARQQYTITVVGADRAKASRSVVVRNIGYVR